MNIDTYVLFIVLFLDQQEQLKDIEYLYTIVIIPCRYYKIVN